MITKCEAAMVRSRGKVVSLAALAAAVLAALPAAGAEIPKNDVWPRPTIRPMPDAADGVAKPVISLRGTWKISMTPPANFFANDADLSAWRDVRVPGQVDRQGLGGRGGPGGRGGGGAGPVPYAYKTPLSIPADFAGKRIFLQFQGVTGTATIWVNGTQVGKPHVGGFTLWDADITDHVHPGDDNWLTVQVKEPSQNDSSVGNRYPGGIIRNLYLMALPADHLTRFNVETDFDAAYKDAVMKVWLGAGLTSDAAVDLSLTGPDGADVPLARNHIPLSPAQSELIADIPVPSPAKWDAEHPTLYTLRATLVQRGKATQVVSKKVGFRKVVIDGRRLLVNGKEIKLRGAGQFDSSALDGRTLFPGEAEADVKLYRAANMNFARPAVYPANVEFLEACDKYGLYVMCECPVWNSGTPEMTPIYLSQTSEMVEAYRTHPSIILWNLANETNYSVNIRREFDYITAEDPTRPIVFSWSHTAPADQPLPYTVYSYHYPNWDVDLGKPGVAPFNGGGRGLQIPVPPMPVIHDEYAHPATYDNEERGRDPNVRAFWGEGLKIFWERMFVTEGALGGAIWGFNDDPISSSENVYGWGIVDVWRRPKPEFYLTKKAYSPVRLDDKPVPLPAAGPLALPIKNWFDHTNLNELHVLWRAGADAGLLPGPNVQPHEAGTLVIPARQWKQGDIVDIKFATADGAVIDEYKLPIAPPPFVLPAPAGPAPRVTTSGDRLVVSGTEFSISFSKTSGSITDGTFHNTQFLKGGPTLSIIGATLTDWNAKQVTVDTEGNEAVVKIAGSYNALPEQEGGRGGGRGRGPAAPVAATNPSPVDVRFEIRIDGKGAMTTTYVLDRFEHQPTPPRVVPWNNTNAGGYQEIGVTYLLTGAIDQLAWRRNGLWSAYPDDHIARLVGLADRRGLTPQVNVKPVWNWSFDETPAGAGTNDFRSKKEFIYYAAALVGRSKLGVRAESNGTDAVRLEVTDPSQPNSDVRMHINNLWNYRNLGNGNYMKAPVIVKSGYTNTVRLRLVENADRLE
jgi:hypothetical protein